MTSGMYRVLLVLGIALAALGALLWGIRESRQAAVQEARADQAVQAVQAAQEALKASVEVDVQQEKDRAAAAREMRSVLIPAREKDRSLKEAESESKKGRQDYCAKCCADVDARYAARFGVLLETARAINAGAK